MSGHRRTLGETLLAYRAAERLLSRMGAKVSGEIGSLGEGLTTYIAAIRLLARVGSHVCLERGWTSIALATYLTDVVARLAGGLVAGLGARRAFRETGAD